MHIRRWCIRRGRDSGQAITAVSFVSLHIHTSTFSLWLTPTLIYSAPDLLLFCHPDMFNKYCLPGQDTPEVLLWLCTSADGLHVIQAFSYRYLSAWHTLLHKHRRCGYAFYFNLNVYSFSFSASRHSAREARHAVSGEGDGLRALPLQSLGTKATKHASVNISVASAPRPGSCCSLSAGPQSAPLCVPWQTVLCGAAGHGRSVVGRQRCLHACSGRAED